MTRSKVIQKITIFLILIVAAVLRMGWPDTIEFGYDQPNLATQVQRFIDTGNYFNSQNYFFPTPWGNVPWGPALIFIHVPFFLISSNPVIISLLISLLSVLAAGLVIYTGITFFDYKAGILAGLFIALQPWQIIFSRMIYQPTVTPLISIICILLTFHYIKNKNSALLSWLMLLWGIMLQVYLSMISIAVVSFLSIVKIVHWKSAYKSILSGFILLILLYYPSIIFYFQNPNYFTSFFAVPNQFGTEKQSFIEREKNLFVRYLSIMSGGEFNRQLGNGYDQFYKENIALFYAVDGIKVLIAGVIMYSTVILFITKNNIYFRILLLIWSVAPVWFLSIIKVPDILPRYFLLAIPALSLLFGIFISDLYKMFEKVQKMLGYALIITASLILSPWIVLVISYYSFIVYYNYPAGFLSHYSDTAYSFLDKSMSWIQSDSRNKGYNQITISYDENDYKKFNLYHAAKYYWEYVLKKDYSLTENAKNGYYILKFNVLGKNIPVNDYRQFGPYLVYEYTDIE